MNYKKIFTTLRYTCLLAVIVLGLITIIGTGGSSDNGSSNGSDNGDDQDVAQTTLYNDYKTLSAFANATALAKFRFMSVMSNGFETPYGEVLPDQDYVTAYIDSHTHVLESLDDVEAAISRIGAAKEQSQISSAPLGYKDNREVLSGQVATIEEPLRQWPSLRSTWDFIVGGLRGSSSRSRQRTLDVLDEISEDGRREAYEYLKASRSVDYIEDNHEDFWESFRQGEYDAQAAQWYNTLTDPSATIVSNIEFADRAERGTTNGRADFDAVLEEGPDLIDAARDFNPGIDGNVLGDQIEDDIANEMHQEVERYRQHTEENYHGDPDSAIESFVQAVSDMQQGAADLDLVNRLRDAIKKTTDAITPADDEDIPPDRGLLTVKDENEDAGTGSVVTIEGREADGRTSIYIGENRGGSDDDEGVTFTLPPGTWDVIVASAQSVIDSVEASVLEGLETIETVNTTPEEIAVDATVTILPPRIMTYELAQGATQVTHDFEAVGRPDDVYRFEWNFGDGTTHNETREPGERSQVSHDYTGLKDGDEFRPTVRLRDPDGNWLAEDGIVIRISGEVESPLLSIDCGWDVDFSELIYRHIDDDPYFAEYFAIDNIRKHGPEIQYIGGTVAQHCFYRGTVHGISRGWDDDGGMTAERLYVDGELYGRSQSLLQRSYGPVCRVRQYDENGSLIHLEDHEGLCEWQWWAPVPTHPSYR